MAALRLRGADKMIRAFSGLLLPIAVIALIIFGIRKIRSGEGLGAIQGYSVRRFFQYLILFGLIVVSAIGLSGLLGRVLEHSTLVLANRTDLARNLSFVVVGVPLYIALALWTRRKFAEDASETESFGWSFYITLVSITSLIIGMFALHDELSWAVRINDYRGPALARLIIWGTVWAGHWWVHLRFTPTASSRAHHLLGSLIALGTVVIGLDQVFAGTIHRIWNFGGTAIFLSHGDPILRGAATLLVGASVWFLYWIKNYSRANRDPLWFIYVLLVGVGGGLVMAILSSSTVLYTSLVWFVGDKGSIDAATHFRSAPTAAATVCVGLIVWWYHHAILDQDPRMVRTEIQRVYEYLMAGIGLLAAAGGLVMILVALLETLTSSSLIVGSGATNALLAAATLLLVGSPVWWVYWRRIENAIQVSAQEEHASPTRRVYLFILFGVGGVVAIVTLLVGVFFLFDDIFKGNFGLETIRRIRFALAVLITTATIAGYHWVIYRSEKDSAALGVRGPRFVLLVGPKDLQLALAVSTYTGGRVQSWSRKDDQGTAWSQDEVIRALENTQDEAVILLADSSGLQIIPIDR